MDNYRYTSFACMWIITVILLLIVRGYYSYTTCIWIITIILLVCGRLQLYLFCLYVDNYSYTAFACMWIITVILLVCG